MMPDIGRDLDGNSSDKSHQSHRVEEIAGMGCLPPNSI